MNAKKFFAACTAAVLTLGFSLGASSAALANDISDEPTVESLQSQVDEQSDPRAEENTEATEQREVEVVSTFVAPVAHDANHVAGGPHPDGGANKVTICHATPPDTAAQGWNSLSPDDDAVATNQAGHASEHDMDIIPAFEYWLNTGNGNGPNSNWIKLTYPGKNLTTDFGGVTGAEILANDCVKPTVTPPVFFEVGLYLYKKLDANAPASWPNSGPQTLIDFKEGTEWFTEFPADLPSDVCGSGWAVQQDKVSYTGTFTWPNSITYPHDNIGWPPIYDAKHDNLENYVDVPDCEVATAVVTVAERDCYSGTSFVIDEENSENVTWGEPVIDDEGDTISITATADPGSRFDTELEGVSDDGIQRTFTAKYEPADDCELGSVVVPLVTWVDECVDEIRLDLAAAMVGVASFTVTDSPNVSYSYTINGGAPIDIVFPDGVDEVTIAVTPGDTVEVTATAADGFELPDDYEPFVKEFLESAFCLDLETGPATTASVEFTLGECEGDSSVELTDEGGVVWRINGVIVQGNTSHDLTAGSDVQVTATLAEADDEFPLGWTWSDPEQVTSWEESVAASDPNCDPELLATTGLASMGEHLGLLAVLLTLTGMGLVARKHRMIAA